MGPVTGAGTEMECLKVGGDKPTGALCCSGHLGMQALSGGSQPFRDINQERLVQRRNTTEVDGSPVHCEVFSLEQIRRKHEL